MSKIRLFNHSLLWLTTASLLVLAFLFVAARVLISQAPSYKADIEEFISVELEEQVMIGSFSATIDGFRPQLKLNDVTVTGDEGALQPLKIGQINVSFNLLYVLTGKLTPEKIILSDTRLSVKRFKDGRIAIDGLPEKEQKDQTMAQEDFDWILDDGTFEIVNSDLIWSDELKELPPIELKGVRVILRNDGDVHKLSLGASIPDISEGPVSFIVTVVGDVLSSSDWDANGYLKANKADLSKIKKRLNVDYFRLKGGLVDLEIWNSWKQGVISNITGRAVVMDTVFLHEESELDVKETSSWFAWNKRAEGWLLNLGDLSFDVEGVTLEKAKAQVDYASNAQGDYSLAVKSSAVDIQTLSSLVKQSPMLIPSDQKMLEQLNPQGSLDFLDFQFKHSEVKDTWAICGSLQGFSNNAVNGIPETKNITTLLCSTEHAGWASLGTSDAQVYLKGFFNQPFDVDDMRGVVGWNRSDDGFDVNASHLQLNSPHVKTESRIKLNFKEGKNKPFADIQMNIGAGDAKYVPLYTPLGILPEKVGDWLNAAFNTGRLKEGGLLVRGDLTDYPYEANQGVFQFLGQAEDISLHYADEWPDIVSADAEVELNNERLMIRATKGSIAENTIQYANIGINDLTNITYLDVEGRIDDEIKGLYAFFWQSPLKDVLRPLMQHTRVLGRAQVNLDLEFPLQTGLEPKINIEAALNKNTFVLPDIDLAIQNIKGTLNYGHQGLVAKRIDATVLNKPTNISINNINEKTVISLAGELDAQVLSKKYPSALWEKTSGKTQGVVNVSVPLNDKGGKAETTVTLKTDLNGVAIKLPAPYGKAPDVKRALTTTISLKEGQLPLSFSYENKAQGALLFKQNQAEQLLFDRGEIRFGRSKAKLPAQSGLNISGNMTILDADEWYETLTLSQSGKSTDVPVNHINLKIGRLDWQDWKVDDITVSVRQRKTDWVGDVRSAIVSGEFVLPKNLEGDDVIQLDLEKLSIPKFDYVASSGAEAPLSPSDMPEIDFKTKDLLVGDTDLGSVELQLRKNSRGVAIEKFVLKSERDELNAYGAWEQTGDVIRSGFDGTLKSKSLGTLFKEAGFYSNIDGASGSVVFDLNWPGGPYRYSNGKLNGFAQVRVGEGRLIEIEPGIGRLFGLFSLSTLQRRMKLDFSDVVREGFSFDKIRGEFVIVDGTAQMSGFYLESPSARLGFEGEVSLKNEEIDQLITVVPQTTDSLPVAGAILGGPLVGAAVFIVHKIAGETVNEFAGYQYQAKGPWKDIEIKQISEPGGEIFSWTKDRLSPVFGNKKVTPSTSASPHSQP